MTVSTSYGKVFINDAKGDVFINKIDFTIEIGKQLEEIIMNSWLEINKTRSDKDSEFISTKSGVTYKHEKHYLYPEEDYTSKQIDIDFTVSGIPLKLYIEIEYSMGMYKCLNSEVTLIGIKDHEEDISIYMLELESDFDILPVENSAIHIICKALKSIDESIIRDYTFPFENLIDRYFSSKPYNLFEDKDDRDSYDILLSFIATIFRYQKKIFRPIVFYSYEEFADFNGDKILLNKESIKSLKKIGNEKGYNEAIRAILLKDSFFH